MDTKKVQSIYYNSKINPVTIQAHIKDSELFISNTRKSGFILKLIWDPYRHIYYCLNRGPYVENIDAYKYSIITYDEDFNKLDETKIDHNKFNLTMFVASKGLYISQHPNDKMKSQTYSIFKYEG